MGIKEYDYHDKKNNNKAKVVSFSVDKACRK